LSVRYFDRVRPPFAVARNTFTSNGTFFAFFVMTDPLEAPHAENMLSLLTTPVRTLQKAKVQRTFRAPRELWSDLMWGNSSDCAELSVRSPSPAGK
jgi:hypothetical protein